MAQPGPLEIPQEIIDEIIDHSSRDKKTLTVCSLTSRTWVYRTRKHLFRKLTLTDKSLRGVVATVPAPNGTGWKPESPSPDLDPPTISKPYTSSWLSSYVTSLKIVPTYSNSKFGAPELFQAKSYLSSFTHVRSLDLGAISFVAIGDTSLGGCLGSLGKTVHELRLSFCHLDEGALFAFLRLFARLESLELYGNVWVHNRNQISQRDPPTLRGSLTASEFTEANGGSHMLDSLMTARVEYETITLGYNPRSMIPKFNTLFTKCQDHLKTMIFTTPESGPLLEG
jgi:hypothetical protein